MKEHIYFYYTNDLHSYFKHWPQVASFIKEKRQQRIAADEFHLLFDIGDHMDRVHPITEATMGKANVELLNNLQYDVATIGNNEGITLAHDDFYHLYDDATFQVICSNLQCKRTNNPPWLLSSSIKESFHGVKIGILGLTARFNPYYHPLGWDVASIDDVLDKEVANLEKKSDIIVLLSHTGINEDERIAKRYPEIDVIIGGHTHHLLPKGEMVNETLLTAAGRLCEHVGEVKLTYDLKNKKLIDKTAITTNVTTYPKDLQTNMRLTELKEAANVILHKEIIETKHELKVSWFKETKIMNDLTKETLRFTEADVAMLNAGLLLEGFPEGVITYHDVHRICPHPINLCVVSLTGNELLEVIRASLTKEFMELQLKGFGFRGEVLGKMIFAGVDVMTDVHENGEQYVKEVLFQGERLHPKQTYNVATADTFTFGRLLPEVAKSNVKQLFLPEFIRDILVQTLIQYNRVNK